MTQETYVIQLLYPEKRRVSQETIITWHDYAISKGEIDPSEKSADLDQAIRNLSDVGHITVARIGPGVYGSQMEARYG